MGGMFEKGLVQIYTGSGKGKTTAAFGLALRAAGHGARVLIYQFLKPAELDLGERAAFTHIDNVTVKAIDKPWDMQRYLEDKSEAAQMRGHIAEALREVETAAHEKYYDVIVLDEIVFCVGEGLADKAQVRRLIENRHPGVEIVLTGRGASEELIELADLVTEMRMVKHPFEKGQAARRGIEY